MTSTTASARPAFGLILGSLLRADLGVLRRSWRLQLLNLGLPVIVLVTSALQRQGRPVDVATAATLVGTAISAGPLAAGVFGYPLGIARDRESGVFQRLRVTPTPTWTIMASRLVLQVVLNVVVALVVAGIGAVAFKLPLGVPAYLSLIPAAIVAGAVFLSIGQALAGLLPSAAAVNAVGRIVFIALFVVGLIGLNGGLGEQFKTIAQWSPVGSTVGLFHTALAGTGWAAADTRAVLACLGYVAVFSFLGIRYFRWAPR